MTVSQDVLGFLLVLDDALHDAGVARLLAARNAAMDLIREGFGGDGDVAVGELVSALRKTRPDLFKPTPAEPST